MESKEVRQEPVKVICVVGFRLDRKHSIGYNSFEDSEEVAKEVKRLLDDRGAQVISIRTVESRPECGTPSINHNKEFVPSETCVAEIEEKDKPVLPIQLFRLGKAVDAHPQGVNILNQYLEEIGKEAEKELTQKECAELMVIKLQQEKDSMYKKEGGD